MGRTSTPTVQPETDVELNPEVVSSQTLLNSMQQQYGEERDLVNQLLGQAQMAGAFESFPHGADFKTGFLLRKTSCIGLWLGKKSARCGIFRHMGRVLFFTRKVR